MHNSVENLRNTISIRYPINIWTKELGRDQIASDVCTLLDLVFLVRPVIPVFFFPPQYCSIDHGTKEKTEPDGTDDDTFFFLLFFRGVGKGRRLVTFCQVGRI